MDPDMPHVMIGALLTVRRWLPACVLAVVPSFAAESALEQATLAAVGRGIFLDRAADACPTPK